MPFKQCLIEISVHLRKANQIPLQIYKKCLPRGLNTNTHASAISSESDETETDTLAPITQLKTNANVTDTLNAIRVDTIDYLP